MNKILFSFLFFILSFNYYVSQIPNDFAYMFDGEVKLENDMESESLIGSIDDGLFLKIIINNKNYKFLVDSGASTSVLTDKLFKNIIDSKKKIKTRDAIGNEEEKDLFYLDFKIGENQFSNFAFVKYDLSKFSNINCSKFDGILGANVLKKLNWKFVKMENKLFFSKTPFTYEGFSSPTILQWGGSIPMVELKVNDYKFLALIDTGFFGTFIIPDHIYINNLGFGTYYNSTKGKGDPISTINGSQKLKLKKARIENFSLENYDFSGYEVILTAKGYPNIGNKIILNNGFIFNFLKNEIAFGINEEISEYAILPKIKTCKSEKDNSKVQLCFFWDEPQNRKLKVGDQIIKVDSIDTSNISPEEYCKLLDYLSSNKTPRLTLKRKNRVYEHKVN